MQKWEYRATRCVYGEGKEWGLESQKASWFLYTGQTGEGVEVEGWMSLSEGLDHFGELGWELVGLQLDQMYSTGNIAGEWYHPDSRYVFKRPKP